MQNVERARAQLWRSPAGHLHRLFKIARCQWFIQQHAIHEILVDQSASRLTFRRGELTSKQSQ